jgi:hypothetical protein
MEFSKGNTKIGRNTLIFNMGPAKTCPSLKLGLCQLDCPGKCYAHKAEVQYPAVLPYRQRQAKSWKRQSYLKIAWDIADNRTKNTKYVRFNESGDFYGQSCIEKLKDIAWACPDLKFYGYTARKDLSFAGLPDNLCINGSNWRRGKMNSFTAVKAYSGDNPICAGDCRICGLCKKANSLTIECLLH